MFKTIRNQEAYNKLGKYEKLFYDKSDTRYTIILPFLSFGAVGLSVSWHWWVFPLFLFICFIFMIFLLDKFSSIDKSIYYCDKCETECESLGIEGSYDMDSVYYCPCCKEKIYV